MKINVKIDELWVSVVAPDLRIKLYETYYKYILRGSMRVFFKVKFKN